MASLFILELIETIIARHGCLLPHSHCGKSEEEYLSPGTPSYHREKGECHGTIGLIEERRTSEPEEGLDMGL